MTPVGETLRRARLKRNLELNRIADELKISTTMLKAIEEEHFEKLPGGVFVRSFVRQYARFLELDEQELTAALQESLGPPQEAPHPSVPAHAENTGIPLPRMNGWQAISDPTSRWASSVRALGLVVLVLLVCAGAYAWLQRERRPLAAHREKAQVANGVPASAPPAPASRAIAADQRPDEAEALRGEPASAAEPKSAVQPESAAPAPKPEPSPNSVAAAINQPALPAESPAPPAAAGPDAPVRVEVVADEESWVSLSADGKSAFTGVLDASQSRTVAANRSVWLKVGNAGGVTVRLNGKPIGPLGANGEVKTLQLTSGGFRILPPDVPKPAPPTDPANPL